MTHYVIYTRGFCCSQWKTFDITILILRKKFLKLLIAFGISSLELYHVSMLLYTCVELNAPSQHSTKEKYESFNISSFTLCMIFFLPTKTSSKASLKWWLAHSGRGRILEGAIGILGRSCHQWDVRCSLKSFWKLSDCSWWNWGTLHDQERSHFRREKAKADKRNILCYDSHVKRSNHTEEMNFPVVQSSKRILYFSGNKSAIIYSIN